MDRWIIQPNVLGGWDVKAREAARPSFQTSTRKEAEDWAQTASVPGDTVVVVSRTGQTLNRITVPGEAPALKPSRAPAARTKKSGPADQGKTSPKVTAEGSRSAPAQHPMLKTVQPTGPKHAAAPELPEFQRESNWVNDQLANYVPVIAGLGAAVVSREVAKAAEDGWAAVFIVTLPWSLGCAIATYIIKSYSMQFPQAVVTAAASMVAAWLIAGFLGTVLLDMVDLGINEARLYYSDSSLVHWAARVLITFALAASTKYGALAAGFSAALGVWLGLHAAKRFPAT